MSRENGLSNDRLQQLLELWDDLRKQGHEPTPEELCENDPELLDELRKRIAALKATNWLEKPFNNDNQA
jgi:DNA-binding transcriptional MerR regulator